MSVKKKQNQVGSPPQVVHDSSHYGCVSQTGDQGGQHLHLLTFDSNAVGDPRSYETGKGKKTTKKNKQWSGGQEKHIPMGN